MPVPPTPDDRGHRALLILLLLAREAGLAPDQVVSPHARRVALRGLGTGTARRYRAGSTGRGRHPWMCPAGV